MAQMDLNKLTTGDKVIGVSGIVLFIASFFKWLGLKFEGGEVLGQRVSGDIGSKSGWGFTLTLIAVLIGIALVVLVALKASDAKLPNLGGVSWAQIMLGAAAVAFIFVLIKLIAGFDTSGVSGLESTRKIGIFIGIIASAGLVAGAWLNFQMDKARGSSSAGPTA